MYISIILIIILSYGCTNSIDRAKDLPNVFIISFEGISNKESRKYLPKFWDKIAPSGTVYTGVKNTNFQLHMPSVLAMITGHNYDGWIGSSYELKGLTIFQHVKKKYELADTQSWVVGSWHPMKHKTTEGYGAETYPINLSMTSNGLKESYGMYKDYYEDFMEERDLSFIKKDISDEIIKRLEWPMWDSLAKVYYYWFNKIIDKYKPKISMYFFSEPETAHYDSWASYIYQLKQCDQRMLQLWNKVNSDPYYRGNTYFIIAVDHERDFNFMHHSRSNLGAGTKTWLYISGPNIKKNQVIKREVKHADVFSTVAKIFGLKDITVNSSNILYESFEEEQEK